MNKILIHILTFITILTIYPTDKQIFIKSELVKTTVDRKDEEMDYIQYNFYKSEDKQYYNNQHTIKIKLKDIYNEDVEYQIPIVINVYKNIINDKQKLNEFEENMDKEIKANIQPLLNDEYLAFNKLKELNFSGVSYFIIDNCKQYGNYRMVYDISQGYYSEYNNIRLEKGEILTTMRIPTDIYDSHHFEVPLKVFDNYINEKHKHKYHRGNTQNACLYIIIDKYELKNDKLKINKTTLKADVGKPDEKTMKTTSKLKPRKNKNKKNNIKTKTTSIKTIDKTKSKPKDSKGNKTQSPISQPKASPCCTSCKCCQN